MSGVVRLERVLVADPVDGSCVRLLEQHGISVTHGVKLSPQQLLQQVKEYDGVIVRSESKVTGAVLEAGTGAGGRLRVVGRAGTGVDNIDLEAATRLGVYVLNTPGGNSLSACELTCALISALARKVGGGVVSMKEGRWERKQLMGTELYGKTLGVVGLGRIGREVAARMRSYGMRVVGFDPLVSEEQARQMGVQLHSDLDTLWPLADYVTLHVPLNKHTKDLVNERTLSKCRRGVKIVNVARGGIVHEAQLLAALNSGVCGGAALDVYSEEPPKSQHIWDLIKHPLVLPTPHLGASTEEAQVRVAEEIAQQFVALAHPTSGYRVSGAVNSDVLGALSDAENCGLAVLGRRLGSLAASLLPLSRLHVHVHSVSGKESRWVLGCLAEGLTGCLGPGSQEEARRRGLDQLTYQHSAAAAAAASQQQQQLVVTLTTTGSSTTHTLTGSVEGAEAACLRSVDGAEFQPPLSLAPGARLVASTSPPHVALNKLCGEREDVSSVGVARSATTTWICYNTTTAAAGLV